MNDIKLGQLLTKTEFIANSPTITGKTINESISTSIVGRINGKRRRFLFTSNQCHTYDVGARVLVVAIDTDSNTALMRLGPKENRANLLSSQLPENVLQDGEQIVIPSHIVVPPLPKKTDPNNDVTITPPPSLSGPVNDLFIIFNSAPKLSIHILTNYGEAARHVEIQFPEFNVRGIRSKRKTITALRAQFPSTRYILKQGKQPNDKSIPHKLHLAQCIQEIAVLNFIAASLRATIAELLKKAGNYRDQPKGALIKALKAVTRAVDPVEEIGTLVQFVNKAYELAYTIQLHDASAHFDKIHVSDTPYQVGYRLVMYLLQQSPKPTVRITRVNQDIRRDGVTTYGRRICYNVLFATTTAYTLKLLDMSIHVHDTDTRGVRLTLDLFHSRLGGTTLHRVDP